MSLKNFILGFNFFFFFSSLLSSAFPSEGSSEVARRDDFIKGSFLLLYTLMLLFSALYGGSRGWKKGDDG